MRVYFIKSAINLLLSLLQICSQVCSKSAINHLQKSTINLLWRSAYILHINLLQFFLKIYHKSGYNLLQIKSINLLFFSKFLLLKGMIFLLRTCFLTSKITCIYIQIMHFAKMSSAKNLNNKVYFKYLNSPKKCTKEMELSQQHKYYFYYYFAICKVSAKVEGGRPALGNYKHFFYHLEIMWSTLELSD